jgi:Helix-turn-helix domain
MGSAFETVQEINHQAGAPWSIRDAARFIGVSEKTICRLIDSDKVRSFKVARRVMIPDDEIRRVATSGV